MDCASKLIHEWSCLAHTKSNNKKRGLIRGAEVFVVVISRHLNCEQKPDSHTKWLHIGIEIWWYGGVALLATSTRGPFQSCERASKAIAITFHSIVLPLRQCLLSIMGTSMALCLVVLNHPLLRIHPPVFATKVPPVSARQAVRLVYVHCGLSFARLAASLGYYCMLLLPAVNVVRYVCLYIL